MNTAELIGLPIEEAKKKVADAGYEVAPQMLLNCEYRPNRITFIVQDGKVVTASIG